MEVELVKFTKIFIRSRSRLSCSFREWDLWRKLCCGLPHSKIPDSKLPLHQFIVPPFLTFGAEQSPDPRPV
jgi:hypothetical protein